LDTSSQVCFQHNSITSSVFRIASFDSISHLISSHLISFHLAGSNFDDEEQKTTGGRNGYGAKLANIFSSEFVIETADSSRGLKFKQVFSENMSQRSEPEIKKYSGSDFTCVTFKPDLVRFKMDFLDDDIVSLLSKRVFDIAGTNTSSGAKLNIFLNGNKININSFQQVQSARFLVDLISSSLLISSVFDALPRIIRTLCLRESQ
jgi:DNA gyrase/topoisomerase IV subunit B